MGVWLCPDVECPCAVTLKKGERCPSCNAEAKEFGWDDFSKHQAAKLEREKAKHTQKLAQTETHKKGYYAAYVGGHPDCLNRSPGTITITPNLIEFQSLEFAMYQYHLSFPTSNLKGATMRTTSEITAERVWLLGPVIAAGLKEKRKFIEIQHEDAFGLLQTLIFEVPGPDADRVEIIRCIQEAFALSKKQKSANKT